MFCSNCGRSVSFDANYCPNCGNLLKKDNYTSSFKTAFEQEFYLEYDSIEFVEHRQLQYESGNSFKGAFCKAYRNTCYIDGLLFQLPDVDEVKNVLRHNVLIICACRKGTKWGIFNNKGIEALHNHVHLEYDEISIRFAEIYHVKDKVMAFAVCKKGDKAYIVSINSGKILYESSQYDNYYIGREHLYLGSSQYELIVEGEKNGTVKKLCFSHSTPEWYINL